MNLLGCLFHEQPYSFKKSFMILKLTRWVGLLAYILLVHNNCNSSKQLSERQRNKLIEKTEALYIQDQKYRMADAMLAIYYDSLARAEGIDSVYYIKDGIKYIDDEKTMGVERYAEYQIKSDSLKNLRNKYDVIVLNNFFKLINKYGYPGMDRLGFVGVPAYLILVHVQQEDTARLKIIVEHEHEIGNMNNYEYAYIKWHLEGRRTWMPQMGENGEIIIKPFESFMQAIFDSTYNKN